MSTNIVKLESNDSTLVARNYLTETEFEYLKEECSHPATVGHILFDADAEVLGSKNIDEANVAALANVFDICGELTDDLGQKSHNATVFESREMEITCRRLSAARLVVFRSKGNKGVGG